MKKIEIFDPAMCCSTGVCGPSVDPELIRISVAVNNLKNKGIDVTRYNLASEPDTFANNVVISQLLTDKGPDVLPVTLVDGKVVKEKSHLTNEELTQLTDITVEELSQKPVVRLKLNVKK
ncbi:Arsenical resistance operon trans-acting repressor ArsD [Bacillus paranthracis]|uniref:arsenite efflux transporter metallochaperone ArsD n=1 Tax=Bacillus cereus group TaxID=86661 RepID=UPI000A302235|nr:MULTISPECIES: arsenite efflux transporter metallochaperone ArsD [Bacillus cereus group]MCM0004386.1 arsenite efflux transporter metallochaperone ArsD [Bacillus paranthracis]MDA2014452.1 arsenite efflux transporter metallochaperone ArsD [Bacillus cereus]MDK7478047.1 arsenite efflux transporter metallochaperone ArsD [Bacillus cereus]SME15798.1 Arsenical resistance operon trans-acting repressor ArsD [Bacillus paranthracis]HDR4712590.1 arsenite efflux transporter metallochaperone ArsD [Bacillus